MLQFVIGEVTTLAGSGKPGLIDGQGKSAQFNIPFDITLKNGILFVADAGNNCIRMVTKTG